MIDAVDTFAEHFRSRVLAYNPSRLVMGIMDAMDWPPKEIELEAFYLIALGETPSTEAQSIIMPVYTHTLQITWLIAGADITSSTRGNNRGNRYRTKQAMKREILNGLYPYFTNKRTYSQNLSSGALESSELVPTEQVKWSKAVFPTSQPAKENGVIYGIATVYVTDMTDVLTVGV